MGFCSKGCRSFCKEGGYEPPCAIPACRSRASPEGLQSMGDPHWSRGAEGTKEHQRKTSMKQGVAEGNLCAMASASCTICCHITKVGLSICDKSKGNLD